MILDISEHVKSIFSKNSLIYIHRMTSSHKRITIYLDDTYTECEFEPEIKDWCEDSGISAEVKIKNDITVRSGQIITVHFNSIEDCMLFKLRWC